MVGTNQIVRFFANNFFEKIFLSRPAETKCRLTNKKFELSDISLFLFKG